MPVPTLRDASVLVKQCANMLMFVRYAGRLRVDRLIQLAISFGGGYDAAE
jgi:hypothetical protein